jgi:hypothetical protein
MTGGNAKNIFNPNFRCKDSGTVSAAKPGQGIFTSSGSARMYEKIMQRNDHQKSGTWINRGFGGMTTT